MKITNDVLLEIITEASYQLHSEIRRSFKAGNLENYLTSIGMSNLLLNEEELPLFDTSPDGKILIFGDSQLKDREIYGCMKDFGLPKERVELHLGYEDAKTFAFKTLQYNPRYRLILFGPIPHSTKDKEDSSSIITNLERKDGYPKVIRLSDGNELKITKSSLKRVIEQQIHCGYLEV